MPNCKFCEKECKPLGLSSHERLCKLNPFYTKEKHPSFGRIGKNQFTKAKENGIYLSLSSETKNKIANKARLRVLDDVTKNKISLTMKKVVKEKPEKYSAANINGRVKKIKYGEILLDGKWEVEFAKWCDANNIKWKKNLIGFEYEWNGKRTYYPDFYLPKFKLFVEVKGYVRERDKHKWKVVKNLVIIKYNQITKIIKGEFSINDFRNNGVSP